MADKNNPLTHIYCFLDTNILMEFQTFDEVEWPQLLNAQRVCLVLAPIVVYELDKHKSDYSNSRRQKRARMLLSKLNKLLDTERPTGELPQVRRNVTLMTLKEPLIDWRAEGLDSNVPDDRFIGSILDFRREHPSEAVCLLSDDSGPRFKAKTYNITAFAPKEDLLRHIEPPSPDNTTS
jgi:predicted ribonuclease YlaK